MTRKKIYLGFFIILIAFIFSGLLFSVKADNLASLDFFLTNGNKTGNTYNEYNGTVITGDAITSFPVYFYTNFDSGNWNGNNVSSYSIFIKSAESGTETVLLNKTTQTGLIDISNKIKNFNTGYYSIYAKLYDASGNVVKTASSSSPEVMILPSNSDNGGIFYLDKKSVSPSSLGFVYSGRNIISSTSIEPYYIKVDSEYGYPYYKDKTADEIKEISKNLEYTYVFNSSDINSNNFKFYRKVNGKDTLIPFTDTSWNAEDKTYTFNITRDISTVNAGTSRSYYYTYTLNGTTYTSSEISVSPKLLGDGYVLSGTFTNNTTVGEMQGSSHGYNIYVGDVASSLLNNYQVNFAPGMDSEGHFIDSYDIRLVYGSMINGDYAGVDVVKKTTGNYLVDFQSIKDKLESKTYIILYNLYSNGTLIKSYVNGNQGAEYIQIYKNKGVSGTAVLTNGLGDTNPSFYFGYNVPSSFRAKINTNIKDTDTVHSFDANFINMVDSILPKTMEAREEALNKIESDGIFYVIYKVNSSNPSSISSDNIVYNSATSTNTASVDIQDYLDRYSYDKTIVPATFAVFASDGIINKSLEIGTIENLIEYGIALNVKTDDIESIYTGDVSDSYYNSQSNKQSFDVTFEGTDSSATYTLKEVSFYANVDGQNKLLKTYTNNSGTTITASIKDFDKNVLKNLDGIQDIYYTFKYSYNNGTKTITADGTGSFSLYFEKNTKPSITNVKINQTSGVVSGFTYTFNDDYVCSDFNSLKAEFYYTVGNNSTKHQLDSLTKRGTTGTYTVNFKNANLFGNDTKDITIWYQLDDGIADTVVGKINETPISLEKSSSELNIGVDFDFYISNEKEENGSYAEYDEDIITGNLISYYPVSLFVNFSKDGNINLSDYKYSIFAKNLSTNKVTTLVEKSNSNGLIDIKNKLSNLESGEYTFYANIYDDYTGEALAENLNVINKTLRKTENINASSEMLCGTEVVAGDYEPYYVSDESEIENIPSDSRYRIKIDVENEKDLVNIKVYRNMNGTSTIVGDSKNTSEIFYKDGDSYYFDVTKDLSSFGSGASRKYNVIYVVNGTNVNSEDDSNNKYEVSPKLLPSGFVLKGDFTNSADNSIHEETIYVGDVSSSFTNNYQVTFSSGVNNDGKLITSYDIKLVSDNSEIEVVKNSDKDYLIDFDTLKNKLGNKKYKIVYSLYSNGELVDSNFVGKDGEESVQVYVNKKPSVSAVLSNGYGEEASDDSPLVYYYGSNIPKGNKGIISLSLAENDQIGVFTGDWLNSHLDNSLFLGGLTSAEFLTKANNNKVVLEIYGTNGRGETFNVYNSLTDAATNSIDIQGYLNEYSDSNNFLPITYTYFVSDGLNDETGTIGTISNLSAYESPKLTFNLNSTRNYYTGDVSDDFYTAVQNGQSFNVSYTSKNSRRDYTLKEVSFYANINGQEKLLKTYTNNSGSIISVNIGDFDKNVLSLLDGNQEISYKFKYSYLSYSWFYGVRTITEEGYGTQNINFKHNTKPSISNVNLVGNNGHYYTKDIKSDLATKLSYRFEDDGVYLDSNSLKVSFYYTLGNSDRQYSLNNLGKNATGDYTISFKDAHLFEDNQQNVTIWYKLEDGISDVIIGKVNNTPVNFESISKTLIYGDNSGNTEGVTITNTFSSDLVIYYGDVKDSAKSELYFYTSKVLDSNKVSVSVGRNNFNALESSVQGDKTLFKLKLSEQNFTQQTGNKIKVVINDGLTDEVVYYVGKKLTGNILNVKNGSTYFDEANAYGFSIFKNVKPSLDLSNTKVEIPSINNGIIYTITNNVADVRQERRSNFKIKVNDDENNENSNDNVFNVYFDDSSRYQGKSGELKEFDLSDLAFNGNKYTYIKIDDGIADAQYYNLSGNSIDASNNANKTVLKFVQNKQPSFSGKPTVSNVSTGNKIYYGDVNVSSKVSVLQFSATFKDVEGSKKEYKIYNGSFNNEVNDRYFDSSFSVSSGKTYEGPVSYNLTEKNYEKYSTNNSFFLSILLDDGIAEIYKTNVGNYTFIKNDKPKLSGNVIYGTGYNNKTFHSIFVGLDESATIDQKIETTLSDSIYEGFVYNIYEVGEDGALPQKALDTKEISGNIAPVFSLTDYSKRNLLNTNGKAIVITYNDGIWDSNIANENLRINLTFSQSGKPKIDSSKNYISNAYSFNDKYYIYDLAMDDNYAGENPFKGADFHLYGESSNNEIYLSDVRFEYSTNGGSTWNIVPDSKRNALISLDNQNSTTFSKNISKWFNYTTSSNNLVKFRFSITDELGQTASFDSFGDNVYLVKEYKPGRISRFNMYNKGTNKIFTGSLKKGTEYTFRWSASTDANTAVGDSISKYIITLNGNVIDKIDMLGMPSDFIKNPFVNWKCDVEGDVKFQIYAVDKFGLESSVLTMIRSANDNQQPNEVSDVKSSVTSMNGKEFIKVYGTTSEQRALTTYTLTFTNAGDPDEENKKNDYIESWEIQYNTKDINDEDSWKFLKTLSNSGNQIKMNETVSTTFYIVEGSADTNGANEIYFRVIAKDTQKDSTTSQSSPSYLFTDDNKAPVWDDIDKNRINFHSDDGSVIRIDSKLVDDSEIAYILVNGVDIIKEDEVIENGRTARKGSITGSNNNIANIIYTMYKDGQYWFRIGDVYGNEYSQRFTAEGIDQVPPSVEVAQQIAEEIYTNKPYDLNITAVDSLTGIKKIEISKTKLDGKTESFTSDSSIEGEKQVNYVYKVTEPGDYTVTVWDRAENKTVKTFAIDNINTSKPEFTYTVPEGLKNKKLTLNLEATLNGTRKTGTLGEFKIMKTSTISSYGEIKAASTDGTKATVDISQNGRLDVMFVDIFGNESDIQQIEISNILVGDIASDVMYLMTKEDYDANYTEPKPAINVNGVNYVEWNNKQTTDQQLYAYIKLNADFNGMQYGWFDTLKNGTSNQTYWTTYKDGDESHPDSLLYKFNTGRKAFYVVDIFGNFTQIVVTINGYVAPPDCEINYTILNKESTAENVDVYFEITSGKFIDEGFYNEVIDGVSKNLYNDFVWGHLVDGEFVADSSYKEKSFLYTFTENGTLNVWGRSSIDDTKYENVRITITNIDKSVPVITIDDFEKEIPQADKLTITAHTTSTFFTKEEFVAQMTEMGNNLSTEELDSYTVSADGKTATLTFTKNNQGIFFFAKNAVGTIGNSSSIKITNIYQSKLSMDINVTLEDGTTISYDEYNSHREDYSGVITVTAVATSFVDVDGNSIEIEFKKDENPDCEIVNTKLQTGGNITSAKYVFTQDGSYTFKLRDIYTGYLEKTVVIGANAPSPAEKPEIEKKLENITGTGVPYVTGVKITLTIKGDNSFKFVENSEKTITKEVNENGIYSFTYTDDKGNSFVEEVNISNIYVNTKPTITYTYNEEFTSGTVTLVAYVSGGVFVDYNKSDWLVLTDVNGNPTSMQRVLTKNDDVFLYAKDFYEDSASLVEEKISITNIDKEAPLDPDVTYSINEKGQLVISLLDNGDNGTSGTKSYAYVVTKDEFRQEGEIEKSSSDILLQFNDQRFTNGKFSIDIKAIDNAGNISSGISTTFNSDDRLVEDFNQVYNNILVDVNLNDNKSFYQGIVDENRSLLKTYSNDLQKEYVSDKLDLLQNILSSDDSAQAVLIAKIEDGLRSLAKNPSDKTLATNVRGYIAALTDEALRNSYTAQLDSILNLNSIIENKKNATNEFNYNTKTYTVNPVSGVITKSGVDGYYNENGLFVRGYDTNNFYYLEDGTMYPIDTTFRTFTDPNGNVMEIANGLVNDSKYYDKDGNLTEEKSNGGFFDWLGRWHEREKDVVYVTVKFIDYDGTILKTDKVASGSNAVPPVNPTREGYTFNGWDKDYSNVVNDLEIYAVYIENSIITPTPEPTDTPTGTPTDVPTITPTPNPGGEEGVNVSNMTLNRSFATIYVGDSFVLQYSVSPANASYTINWTSSSGAASVNGGYVVGVKAGEAIITATTNNGVSASCKVTVINQSSSGEIIVPGNGDYPTISDIPTPTVVPTNPVNDAPSFNAGTLGNEGVGYTNTTNFDSSNLRGFYNKGYSTLIYNGDGTFDITNKRNANVNLGFLSNGMAVVMDSRDIDSNLSVSSFGLNGTTLSINSGRLGNNSYVVLFTDYNQNTTVKKDGSNIGSDYDFNLGGYKIMNPQAGTYTLGSISSGASSTDLAAMYGFVTDSYSGNITYSEIVKMAYNALNRDFGEELYSSVPTNSPIYRELSILEKYGVIDASINNYYPDVNTPVTGKDAYDIIYMTLSQTNPSHISYNVTEWRYLQGVSINQINQMVASIVQ